jgi:hypothetical protein
MKCRAGFVWLTPQHFNRYIEDCGIACELVTPHLLAAPFYRGTFCCLIIPAGFANPQFSNILPAVRASSERIERFIENGGNLLVFGAAAEKPDAYDWLPFPIAYCHNTQTRNVTRTSSSDAGTLIDDYDSTRIECDGSFNAPDSEHVCTAEGEPVVIERKIGMGRVVITSVHEYPSREFLKKFCCSGKEVSF